MSDDSTRPADSGDHPVVPGEPDTSEAPASEEAASEAPASEEAAAGTESGAAEESAAAFGAEGVPGAGPHGPYAQYPGYPGYGQVPYQQEPSSVRADMKRVLRHRVVQFVGAGLIGAVIGGGAVATVGAFVWEHDSGPQWRGRVGVVQQFPGGGRMGGNGFGADNGPSGTSGSSGSSSGGGIVTQP